MDRLSTLDAEFLHLEDGVAHMHIAGACLFDGAPPGYDDLAALLQSKLHLIPRYRQRVRSVPLELGRPVWVDDPHFDLGYHLRHTALPGPGDDRAFCTLMGRLMSQPLDRDRPLWEAWLVEGLDGGRWALVFKVHHCMVDGIAGVELLEVLLDLVADPPPTEPEPWEPEPEPSGAAKVVDAWSGLVHDVTRSARDLPNAALHPENLARSAAGTATGIARYLRSMTGSEPGSLAGTIGPHRRWAHTEVSLSDVKVIRAAFGGTVNDVVLVAVGGGYRELLLWRGDDADHAVVNTMIPVSTRREDEHGVPDNRVSMTMLELPVHLPDPVERLAAVREAMGASKQSGMAEAGETITRIGDLAPPMLVGTFSRFAIRAMRRLPQRVINTVTTNVPGPQLPLYCLGHEMVGYRPFVPISHGVRIATAILSYNGELSFGITGDATTSPDVDVVAAAIGATVSELVERALDEAQVTQVSDAGQ